MTMTRPGVIFITPEGISTRTIYESYGPDPLHYLLDGFYSIDRIDKHPVAYKLDVHLNENYNKVVSKWIGRPFYGDLIVLDENSKPFFYSEDMFKVIDEISTIFSEVPQNAGN